MTQDQQMNGCEQCGHLSCVCRIIESHEERCPFRLAATCAVGIECEHGRDVCPTCDPCTCESTDETPTKTERNGQ